MHWTTYVFINNLICVKLCKCFNQVLTFASNVSLTKILSVMPQPQFSSKPCGFQCVNLYKVMTFQKHIRHHRVIAGGSDGKESACNAGSLGSIPGLGRSLDKGMATNSSILAWKIPWTEEPDGLQFMWSQRVRHS